MTIKVKVLIERLISVERINKPKQLHKALERSDLQREIDIIPTKQQIVSYIRNRRKRNGDTNEMPAIHEYVTADFDLKSCVCDAANAQSNAIRRLWPSCTVIMCWFHVRQATLAPKRNRLIPVTMRKHVHGEMRRLHEITTKNEFDEERDKLLAKWKRSVRLPRWLKYVLYWFTKKPNWGSHLSPPGWAKKITIETHNRVIKGDWTKYGRYHIVPLMMIFEEMIEYDARNFTEPATVPHVPNTVIASARLLLKEGGLMKISETVFEYTSARTVDRPQRAYHRRR